MRYLGVFLALISSPLLFAEDRSVSFTTDVVPILEAHCASCHVDQSMGVGFSGTPQEVYWNLNRTAHLLSRSKVSRSYLIERAEDGHGDFVEEEKMDKVRRWIREGALAN